MEAPPNPTAATVAATIRWAAYVLTHDGYTVDSLRYVAEGIDLAWDSACCPVCEETTCDDDCPLASVRGALEGDQNG